MYASEFASAAKLATLPIADAQRLVEDVAVNVIGAEETFDDRQRRYVNLYLSHLLNRIDLCAEQAETMADALPGGEASSIRLGHEMSVVKHSMRVFFKNPGRFSDTPLDPEFLQDGDQAAGYAEEAVDLVDSYIGTAYAAFNL